MSGTAKERPACRGSRFVATAPPLRCPLFPEGSFCRPGPGRVRAMTTDDLDQSNPRAGNERGTGAARRRWQKPLQKAREGRPEDRPLSARRPSMWAAPLDWTVECPGGWTGVQRSRGGWTPAASGRRPPARWHRGPREREQAGKAGGRSSTHRAPGTRSAARRPRPTPRALEPRRSPSRSRTSTSSYTASAD